MTYPSTLLVIQSLRNQLAVDLGFDADQVLIVRPNLVRHPVDVAEQVQERLVERVRALPQVGSVSLASWVPLSSVGFAGFVGESQADAEQVSLNYVDPSYFETLSVELVAGEPFTSTSPNDAVVVSEAFVKRFLPGQDPVGRTFSTNQGPNQVVGVVRDTKARDLGPDQDPFVYRRYGIRGTPLPGSGERAPAGAFLLVRTRDVQPGAVVPAIRTILQDIDPDTPLAVASSLRSQVETWLSPARMLTRIVGVFGLLAMLIAAVGLYGLHAQLLSERVKELGIRVALGASAQALHWVVLGNTLRWVMWGVLLGVSVSLVAGRLVSDTLLFETSLVSPVALMLAAVILVASACLISYVPARRAARVDPLVALRYE